MSQKNSAGQSLWEVIIALSIAGLIALGLVRATGSSVKSTRFSSDQSRLTALAQEKIAQIIDYKNKNYKKFWETEYLTLPPDISGTEHNEEEDYCILTRLLEDSNNLPTETPNWGQAKMVKISVDVFWESKSSNPECREADFNHKLKFETTVTNK
ncbi:MAG TPA: hypothetical protein VMW04_00325 [Patescibacteria group bacterium]|nr:hypothetical protein [Patescibacteria group bacterium]